VSFRKVWIGSEVNFSLRDSSLGVSGLLIEVWLRDLDISVCLNKRFLTPDPKARHIINPETSREDHSPPT